MCGVAGIFHHGQSASVDAGALAAMGLAMAHRGPDGDGTWISPNGRAGLAHRRLSIVDLAHDADQPLGNEDGTIWVSYNGEIYNHMELRAELTARGHRFATDHSDTEVLVHGYEEWGIDGLLERLVGMYAFALWDEARTRLTLARDRIGIKPIYFTNAGGRFLFASEIKGLIAHPAVSADVSPTALYHYLTYLTAPAPLSMFRGIHKLPAAHYLTVEAGGAMAARRYWDAEPGAEVPSDPDEIAAGVLERLERAVERRMMSDVPYGAFLSGGIDSSVNTALMSRHASGPVNTFSVGFKDHQRLNELDHARRVASHIGTNHHEVMVGEADMVGYLADLVRDQDEPLADWVCIPLHFVSKLAREAGVKVVQVGEGSDEQFCGYHSYMKYLELHDRYFRPFRHVPGPLRRFVAAGARRVAGAFPDFEIYADAVGRAANGGEAFWSGAVAFWESQKRPLYNGAGTAPREDFGGLIDLGIMPPRFRARDSQQVALAYLEGFDLRHPGRDQLTRMTHNEFRLRLPELLLMRVDKITMASSLEGRVPFLDHELVEYTMSLPATAKISGGKQKALLKRAVAGLIPQDIIDRPKMGFSAPMAEWLRGDFGRQAESVILGSELAQVAGFDRGHMARLIQDHRDGRRNGALLIWVLYNLTAWFDHWVARR